MKHPHLWNATQFADDIIVREWTTPYALRFRVKEKRGEWKFLVEVFDHEGWGPSGGGVRGRNHWRQIQMGNKGNVLSFFVLPFEKAHWTSPERVQNVIAQYENAAIEFEREAMRERDNGRRRTRANSGRPRKVVTHELVATMGAAEINRRLDALDKESSKITREFIDAGRGSERPSETRHMTDPLALRAIQNWTDSRVLRDEVDRRYGTGASGRLPVGRVTIRARRNGRAKARANHHGKPWEHPPGDPLGYGPTKRRKRPAKRRLARR